MPIRIKCPKCQTILGVKESLAGKKASCPKCRGVLTIPMPKAPVAAPAVAAPSSEDADDLALSAFAEDQPKQDVVARPIDFECPFCMEMVQVAANLAGKQTPCPNSECKRIIKVPLPKAEKKKDWRQMDPRSAAADLLRNKEEEPDGAWSSAKKTKVSAEALEEAKAIPVKKRPVSTTTWVRRGVTAFVVLLVLGAATWGTMAWMAGNRLQGPLSDALRIAESDKKLSPAAAADILRGAGESYVIRNKPAEALKYFNMARNKWPLPDEKTAPDAERDLVLLELALAMIDLSGSDKDIADEIRLDWDKVQKELERTLAKLSSDHARQTALREVGTVLIAKGQPDIAVYLAGQMIPAPPAPKVTTPPVDEQNKAPDVDDKKQPQGEDKKDPQGEDKKDPQGDIKKDPQGEDKTQPPAEEKKQQPPEVKKVAPHVLTPLEPARIALLIANNQAAEASKILPAPAVGKGKGSDADIEIDPIARLGYAEGRARLGNFDDARKLANAKGPPLHRLESSIAVAAVAIGQNKTAEAAASAKDALAAYKEADQEKMPVWLAIQLTRVCARAGLASEAKKEVVDKLAQGKNQEAAALAQLELLTAHLAENAGKTVAPKVIDDFVTLKTTLAYGMAFEKVARHNTRLGGRADALRMADDLSDSLKPFVQIGVVLGMLDVR